MSGRKVPTMTTDEAAEAFLEQDLSDLDVHQFIPFIYETDVNMRPSTPLPRAKGAQRSDLLEKLLVSCNTFPARGRGSDGGPT